MTRQKPWPPPGRLAALLAHVDLLANLAHASIP
jgi:hypothetical protein